VGLRRRGRRLTYTLLVANRGPGTAFAVNLSDTLPRGVRLVRASSTNGACSGRAPVRCGLGVLAPGASARVTLVVTQVRAGRFSNRVRAFSSADPDPNVTNNALSSRLLVHPNRSRNAPRRRR
jgi:uncharacterized repeat protein (TIGR01451 family)